MNSDHFTLDELRAFALGHDPEREKLLLEHCRVCSECGDNLAAMLMVTIPATARRSARTTRNVWLAAVAASVILVGALAVTLRTDIVHTPSVQEELAALATTEPPAEFIVRFQLGTLAPVSEGNYLGDLQAGGMLIANGEYEEAAVVLRRVHTNAPADRVVATYLGVAQYLAGDATDDTGALLASSMLVRDVPISELGRWYLANYLLKVGDITAAEEILLELTSVPTWYGGFATKLLAELQERR